MTAPHTSLRLHGYPVSNYFNVARAAMIEKGLGGDFVLTRPTQDESFLTQSAMGKIPYLVTPQGSIAETVAILDYLEETVDGQSLLPTDPFQRARVRQVVNILQIYIEIPMRSLFPGVFMGGHNSNEVINLAWPVIERAMSALSHLVEPKPFLLGEAITQADIFAFYTFDIGERVGGFVYNVSLLDQISSLREWYDMMRKRDSSQKVLADFSLTFAAYLIDKKAAFREVH